MKVLVTGSAGFIGSAVSIKLLDRGFTVFNNNNDEYYYENRNYDKPSKVIKREALIAYGETKVLGISSKGDDLFGHMSGNNSILFDINEDFDKWSKCASVDKDKSFEEIMSTIDTLVREE